MKRSLKLIMTALSALIVPALGWATEVAPWAAWSPIAFGNAAGTTQNAVNGGNWTLKADNGSSTVTDGVLNVSAGAQSPCVDLNNRYTIGKANPLTMVSTVCLPATDASDTAKPLVTFDGWDTTTAFVLYVESVTDSGATFSVGMGSHGSLVYDYSAYTKETDDETGEIDTVTISSITPDKEVTLAVFLSSDGLKLYTVAGDTVTLAKTWGDVKSDAITLCRVTFGGYYNQPATYSYEMKSLAFYRNLNSAVSIFDETGVKIDANSANAAGLGWDNGTPTAESLAKIYATTATTVSLDAALNAKVLNLIGQKVVLTGDSALNVAESLVLDADTEIQASDVTLADIAVRSGKTLAVKDHTIVPETVTVSNGGMIEFLENADFTVAGNNIFNKGFGFAIAADKTLKLNGSGEASSSYFVREGASLDLNGRHLNAGSIITLCNGATLTTAQDSGKETSWIACPSINLYNASTAAKITGASISSVASQNAAHPWYLNGGTLEFALNPGATFYASSINVLKSSGSTEKAGTLKMTSGTVRFVQNAASAEHADVVLNGGEVIVSLNSNSTYKFGSLSGDSGTLRVGTPLEVGALNTDTAAAITITATDNGTGTFKKVGSGTLDLSTAHIANIPFEVAAGTLILPASAGKTNTITVAEGATVKFAMTDAEAFSTCSYDTTKVTGSGTITFCFMDEALNAVLDVENSVSGATYTCPASVWVPASADSTFDTAACWTPQVVPTTGAVVINASAYTGSDVAITIPAGITGVAVKGNATVTTKVAFAADVTDYPNISVDGKVELPIAAINGAEQVAVAVGSTLIANVAADTELTKPLAGNFTFWKNGSGTLTLGANVSPDNGSVICEGIVKFVNNNSDTTSEREPYAFGSNYAAMTGDVRVKAGATLDVNGHKGAWLDMVTLEAGATFANTGGTVDGTQRQCVGIVLEGDATVNTGSFFGLVAGSYAATKVTLNNHTLTKTGSGTFLVKNTALSGGTIAIAEGTVEVQKHGQQNTTSFSEVTVTGDGTLLFNGLLPGTPAGLTADTWTGTVRIKGFAGTTAQDPNGTSCLRIDSYGHAGSEIELDGVQAYINNGTTAASVTLVGNGFQPNNGSSSTLANIVINQLKGSGALKGATGTAEFKYKFVLNDVSDFSGSINLNTDKGAASAVIIADANVDQDSGTILVAAGKTANIAAEQTWTAYAGKSVIVYGTLSGSGTIGSALTLNAGATLDATAETKLSVTGDVTFPTEGTLTVKLAEEATFPAQIIKKSGLVAGDVKGVTLSVVIGDAGSVTKGYKLVATETGYAVALDITVPNKVGETDLDAEAKAALLAIAKDKGTSIKEVVPAKGKKAAEVNAALQLFTGIVEIYVDDEGDTVADIDWDFGISDIVRNPKATEIAVTITAKVQKGSGAAAGFAEATSVKLLSDEVEVEGITATIFNDGTATWSDVPVAKLGGKLKVKATNETTTTNN